MRDLDRLLLIAIHLDPRRWLPAVAREWVAASPRDSERVVTPPIFATGHLRFYTSKLLERITGRPCFLPRLERPPGRTA